MALSSNPSNTKKKKKKKKSKEKSNDAYQCASRQRSRIICGIHPGDGALEDVKPIWNHFTVILNALQPPPHGVTAVIPGVGSFTKEIRDEAMPQGTSKRQNNIPKTPN
jgi:hypothetical protein